MSVLSWDREFDLPDDEDIEIVEVTDADVSDSELSDDEIIALTIAHDVAAMGRVFMAGDPGDDDENDEYDDDDEYFSDDYMYGDSDEDDDDFDDEAEDDEIDPADVDDGYGDEASLPDGVDRVSYVVIFHLNY